MSERIKYTDESLGNLRIVPDFLPPPEKLVPRDSSIKVTIALSRRSVDFFKREALKQRAPYQRIIRRLLDLYAERHERSPRASRGR